jgi:hypothetical protein
MGFGKVALGCEEGAVDKGQRIDCTTVSIPPKPY